MSPFRLGEINYKGFTVQASILPRPRQSKFCILPLTTHDIITLIALCLVPFTIWIIQRCQECKVKGWSVKTFLTLPPSWMPYYVWAAVILLLFIGNLLRASYEIDSEKQAEISRLNNIVQSNSALVKELQAKLNTKPPPDFERIMKDAETRAHKLQENLELARQVSEKQGKELDIARKELKQLQARFAPRSITEKQKIALVKSLRGQSEDRIVTIKTVDGVPPEGFKYAQDFVRVFLAAGWNAKFHGGWYLLIEGVAIRSRSNDMVAVFLRRQFEEAGIKARLIETKDVAENNIDIVIGPRS